MTQGRDKGLDDKGRDKGMTQGYDARAALTGHMLRSLNWHAAIYIPIFSNMSFNRSSIHFKGTV